MCALPHNFRFNAANVVLEQGVGQLFPWNIFINAQNYHSRRFCGSVFEASFEDCFAFAYNLAAIVGLLITLRLVPARYGSLPFRVYYIKHSPIMKIHNPFISRVADEVFIVNMFRYV